MILRVMISPLLQGLVWAALQVWTTFKQKWYENASAKNRYQRWTRNIVRATSWFMSFTTPALPNSAVVLTLSMLMASKPLTLAKVRICFSWTVGDAGRNDKKAGHSVTQPGISDIIYKYLQSAIICNLQSSTKYWCWWKREEVSKSDLGGSINLQSSAIF